MKIKVCGLKYPENMLAIDELNPDFLGLIFYEKSPRYFADDFVPKITAKKVGVFVNETVEKIEGKSNELGLDYIQLHGSESVEFVESLCQKGFNIIKAFSIYDRIDNEMLKQYEPLCNYVLFDTKGKNAGGNGVKFDWNILKEYTLETPFFLSGGIQPKDVDSINAIQHKGLAAVDINSGFEAAAGIKNIELVKQFIHDIRSNEAQTP